MGKMSGTEETFKHQIPFCNLWDTIQDPEPVYKALPDGREECGWGAPERSF